MNPVVTDKIIPMRMESTRFFKQNFCRFRFHEIGGKTKGVMVMSDQLIFSIILQCLVFPAFPNALQFQNIEMSEVIKNNRQHFGEFLLELKIVFENKCQFLRRHTFFPSFTVR